MRPDARYSLSALPHRVTQQRPHREPRGKSPWFRDAGHASRVRWNIAKSDSPSTTKQTSSNPSLQSMILESRQCQERVEPRRHSSSVSAQQSQISLTEVTRAADWVTSKNSYTRPAAKQADRTEAETRQRSIGTAHGIHSKQRGAVESHRRAWQDDGQPSNSHGGVL